MQALGLRRNVQVRDTKLVRQVCGAWGARAAGAWRDDPATRVNPRLRTGPVHAVGRFAAAAHCTSLAATQSALSATGCLNRAVRFGFQFLGTLCADIPPSSDLVQQIAEPAGILYAPPANPST